MTIGFPGIFQRPTRTFKPSFFKACSRHAAPWLISTTDISCPSKLSSDAIEEPTFPVQELSGRQLHQLSSHNVADALRYFSGIQIKDYG